MSREPLARRVFVVDLRQHREAQGIGELGDPLEELGGHAKSSQAIGAKAKFTFTGRMVALVSRLGPTRGYVVILVNGTQVAAVPLRASTASYRRVVWTKWWPTSATRTVTFRVMSVPGPDWVDIDAVLVGN